MSITREIATVRRQLASLARQEALEEVPLTLTQKLTQFVLGAYRDGYNKAIGDVEKGVNP